MQSLLAGAERVLGPMTPGFALSTWPRLRTLAVRALRGKELLFEEGEVPAAFYGVIDGEIGALFSTADGAESVIELIGPGMLFGFSSFVTRTPSTFEARSTRKTTLLVLGPAAYEALVDEAPGFAKALLTELAHRHRNVLEQLGSARHRSAEERLAYAIAGLLDSPRATASAHETQLDLSQAELAEAASLSRQATNEIIQRWVARGLARCGYRRLWVSASLLPRVRARR